MKNEKKEGAFSNNNWKRKNVKKEKLRLKQNLRGLKKNWRLRIRKRKRNKRKTKKQSDRNNFQKNKKCHYFRK